MRPIPLSPHLPILLLFSLSACVPVDQLPPGAVPSAPATGGSTGSSSAVADLDAGNTSVSSTHFTLKGYSEPDLQNLKTMAESLYSKIGNDTGLYTAMASGSFTLVQFKDHDEYMAKTHQPSWSRAMASGKNLYFYPGPDLEPSLAHQMVHMIFEDYMADKTSTFRWIEEGLAMNEEVSKMSESDRTAYVNSKVSQIRQNRMPFSQMSFFVTNSEEKRRTDSWYQQVESVVTYLLAQGSPLAFGQLMSALKTMGDFDRAIADAYAAKFRSLTDLEAAWKSTI